jgi:WbqC-like protein
MIVTLHQPHFLPWLGYLDRMAQADLFVVLDHVQFERRNYQNRTRILCDGEARWFTVPVVQRSQLERIDEKRIDNTASGNDRWWGPKHYKTLCYAYREAEHFGAYAARLRDLLETQHERLLDLNLLLLDFLRDAFEIRTPLAMSSRIGATGRKSELLLNLCREVGATVFLGGLGGSREYLDVEAFERAGIEVRWQDFRHPEYEQRGAARFVAGLSSIDILAHCGPQSRDALRNARLPAPTAARPLGAELCPA